MNISPVKINNISRPVSFGMLKAEGTINPSILKTLLTDDNFVELVKDSDNNGYDTVIKGDMKECSIYVESKENSHNSACLAINSYYEPFDTNFALGSWKELKKTLPRQIVTEQNINAAAVYKMIKDFNRDMGFID